jgi:predicted GIY-YIG superfamily endonuclease
MRGGEKRVVYVLRSDRDPNRHYVGATGDMVERLNQHNAGFNVHTTRHRPWHVIVALEFRTQAAALGFERYLKTGSGRSFVKRHFP